jgi:hypothetical protein
LLIWTMPERPTHASLTLVLLPVFMALISCKISEKNAQDKKATFEALAKAELGEAHEVSYNTPKTYALCQQQRQGDHLRRSFKYIVVRLSDNKVMHKGSFRMGYVAWYDEDSIEVVTASSARDDKKTIIDIRSDQL